MTYLLMSLPFLGVAAAALVVARRRRSLPVPAALGIALAVLLVMTAVFDNVMIGVGLVAYGDAHRLGAAIGLAPVEDFTYPIAGLLLLPALWHLLGGSVGPVAARTTAVDPRGAGR